ncbi:MAG: hypothetical protein M0Q99_12675, partial [Candidatus Cloacimonetes bacterium]|nr:hypothetical protein [Candidatus Cloacimonadota bacterium]
MIPEELKQKLDDLIKTKWTSNTTTLLFFYGLTATETDFAKALESIDLVLHMLNGYIDEPDTEVDTDAYVDIVKDVNDFLLEYREVITENINRNVSVDSLYYAGQVARISTRFQELNDKAPAAIDIHLIFPSILIEDQNVVGGIIHNVSECIEEMVYIEESLDESEEDMDNELALMSPIFLYRILMGRCLGSDVSFFNRYNKMRYIDTVDMDKVKTFYELWRLCNWEHYIDLILWGTDIELSDLSKKDYIQNESGEADTAYDKDLRKLRNHQDTLNSLKKLLMKESYPEAQHYQLDAVVMRVDLLLSIISYLIEKLPVEKAQNEAKIRIEERNRII